MTSHLISIITALVITGTSVATMPVMAIDNNNTKMITIQDKYGNPTGYIKRIGDTHYETDKYGNTERMYKQIGNIVYIYDKYGNVIGSFRK